MRFCPEPIPAPSWCWEPMLPPWFPILFIPCSLKDKTRWGDWQAGRLTTVHILVFIIQAERIIHTRCNVLPKIVVKRNHINVPIKVDLINFCEIVEQFSKFNKSKLSSLRVFQQALYINNTYRRQTSLEYSVILWISWNILTFPKYKTTYHTKCLNLSQVQSSQGKVSFCLKFYCQMFSILFKNHYMSQKEKIVAIAVVCLVFGDAEYWNQIY